MVTATMPIKCPVCKGMLGESDKGYQNHMRRYHNVNATYREPMPKEHKENIVKRVEIRLGQHIIGGYQLICVDCLQPNKPGIERYDGAFLCEDCITLRANSLS